MKRIYTTLDSPTPPDQLLPVSYPVRAALAIGCFIFSSTLLVSIAIGFDLTTSAQTSLALAAIASTIFGVRWSITATSNEIARRRPRYDQPLEHPETPDTIQFSDIDQVARQVLELHYLDRLDATRPECERAGIQQRDWNIANQVFQAIGIKSARSWGEGTFEEALALYRACVRVDDQAIWIRPTPTATSWTRIDR